MKVRVAFTVEVDAQAWADEYGVEVDAVREDVRSYVASSVREHLSDLGLLARTP